MFNCIMGVKLNGMDRRLTPAWIAAINFVGVHYGVWGAASLYAARSHTAGDSALLFAVPLAFGGSFTLTVLPLGWILGLLKGVGPRLLLVLATGGIFLVGHGTPSPWLLAIAGVVSGYVYWQYKKAFADEAELKKL